MTVELSPNPKGYYELADLERPLDFADLFGRSAPVEMEIGAGRGDFLIGYASQNPHLNLIAVERKFTVLRTAIRKVERAGLANVALLNVEIRHLLNEYVPAESLQAAHIYFPDPWPKKRHLRRRFVQPENLGPLLRALKSGGIIYFRTDVQDYFELALEAFDARPELAPFEASVEILDIRTGYEARFLQQGLPIYRASFQKILVPSPTS